MPKDNKDHRAWKPIQVRFFTRQGAKTFTNIIDVFHSKLCTNCIAFIDQWGNMYVTNLPFVIHYERVSKEKGGKRNGRHETNNN